MTAKTQAKREFSFWTLFVRVQNPFMKWLLDSPLHSFVSKWYLMISVTGKKTGNVYTTPVQYKQVAHRLTILTSHDYRWWRNLRGGANIDLMLRGNLVHAYATVSEAQEDVLAAYNSMFPTLKQETRDKMMKDNVVIQVELL